MYGSALRTRGISVLSACGVLLLGALTSELAAAGIREQAVVNLTFDEVSGDAYDSAANGSHQDHGQLAGAAQRVESPFGGQRGKQALIVDAARKQFVQIPDSPDLDRRDGLTLSCFFLSLHDLNDEASHGIVAKRNSGDNAVTNYGINFQAKSNVFQVYLNPGDGYRIAGYSLRDTIGWRQRVFLTATFEVGDAPAPDNDNDRDDVRVQLFVNGQLAAPTSVNPFAAAAWSDAWLTDVDLAALLNDAPLTIGATNPESEYTSAVIDEFSLFPRALTPVEAAMLFVEVGGAEAVDLAQRDRSFRPQPPAPAVTGASLYGLQIGATTRVSIQGRNLARKPQLDLPVEGVLQTVVEGSTPAQLIVDVTLPPEAAPGFYPLRVRTADGISNALAVAVDRLPQRAAAETAPDRPALLPGAFSGNLAGTDQARIYFNGAAEQRIVVEADARRLGSTVDPVLEIKTAEGTPLLIEWGKVFLRGDARAELTLPHDGLYFAELHDLEYKAPGGSPFRVRIGDLTTIDLYYPSAINPGAKSLVKAVGVGIPSTAEIRAMAAADSTSDATLLGLPPELGLSGPAPALRLSDAVEIIEQTPAPAELQTIDARFAEKAHIPLVVSGNLSAAGEEDRYVLQVTPAQQLSFLVAARSIDSPLDGQLLVRKHPEGDVLASSDDRAAGTLDPGLDYTVPEGVTSIQLAVRDLNDAGGAHYLYRLAIAPTGRPDFKLSATQSRIQLPQGGTASVRLKVERTGYAGPIPLRVTGAEGVTISPSEIPAEGAARELFATLTHDGRDPSALARLQIVGESVGLEPPLRSSVEIASDTKDTLPPAHDCELAAAVTAPAGLVVELPQMPAVLLKGLPTALPVAVRRDATSQAAVRLTLLSTEATRPVDPNDRGKGNKPLVRLAPEQFLREWESQGSLNVEVPLDVAQGDIDFVLQAEAVPHAYSDTRLASVYSAPFRLPVRDAVTLTLDEQTLQHPAGKVGSVKGTIQRTAPFAGRVIVSVAGLPEGYLAPAVAVEPGQEQFELKIFFPLEDQTKDLPNVTLDVSAAGGGALLPARPLPLKVVVPAPAEAKPAT